MVIHQHVKRSGQFFWPRLFSRYCQAAPAFSRLGNSGEVGGRNLTYDWKFCV